MDLSGHRANVAVGGGRFGGLRPGLAAADARPLPRLGGCCGRRAAPSGPGPIWREGGSVRGRDGRRTRDGRLRRAPHRTASVSGPICRSCPERGREQPASLLPLALLQGADERVPSDVRATGPAWAGHLPRAGALRPFAHPAASPSPHPPAASGRRRHSIAQTGVRAFCLSVCLCVCLSVRPADTPRSSPPPTTTPRSPPFSFQRRCSPTFSSSQPASPSLPRWPPTASASACSPPTSAAPG
eukprot:scaffold18263_cov93-Isochrysis_galbana.AAC.1